MQKNAPHTALTFVHASPANAASGHQSPVRRAARPGFTLLEVLISVTLVLLIILGVNQVFALTSLAVGSGNALSEAVRDGRNAQSIIGADLSTVEFERAPFFFLDSEVMVGFRNRADQVADIDYSPVDTNRTQVDRAVRTIDRNGNGREDDVDDLTPRAFLTSRTHRADVLKFFTRQSGRRQTGNKTTFTSGVSSSEQYVSYGHLRQPSLLNNITTGRLPGIGPAGTVLQPGGDPAAAASNPNNFYATQWVLGRTAFLLRTPEAVGNTKVIRDTTLPGSPPQTYYGRGVNATTLTPFKDDSASTTDATSFNNSERIQYSFYDLIGWGMEQFRNDVLDSYVTTKSNWHDEMYFRHTGFPTPSRPLTSQGVARTVPCFVTACTQFVVEFGGDFVSQDDAGNITGVTDGAGGGTDGVIDYNVNATTGQRTIRWYGFPRDVNDDGNILPISDVVPLRDYVPTQLPFERTVLTKASNTTRGYGIDQAVPANSHYRVVWGPDTAAYPRPRMLRIVMAVDDPAARIAREQYFEYVFELP